MIREAADGNARTVYRYAPSIRRCAGGERQGETSSRALQGAGTFIGTMNM
jgi:hypothetical protein